MTTYDNMLLAFGLWPLRTAPDCSPLKGVYWMTKQQPNYDIRVTTAETMMQVPAGHHELHEE